MSHKLAVTLVAASLFIPPLALAAGPGGTGAVGGGGAAGGVWKVRMDHGPGGEQD